MKELHALVDFENVQPSFEELGRLAPGFTDVWLFHGPNQIKQAQRWTSTNDRVALVPRTGRGPNALDFHLSFYLGYVAARHSKAQLVVVANDRGYDPMIAHARLLEFSVRRVGFKAKKAASVQTPAAGKEVALAAKPTPAEKSPPMKAVTPLKSQPSKKPAAKAVPAKTPSPTVARTKPKVATAAEAALLTRVLKALAKMGDKRPHKLASFQRHLGSMLGKDNTPAAVEVVVQSLEKANVVHISGDLVLYN